MKLSRVFAFSYALIICFGLGSYLKNGLKKNNLLDEFFADDPILTKYLSYKKHFNEENSLYLFIHRKDLHPFQLNDLSEIKNSIDLELKHILDCHLLTDLSIYDLKNEKLIQNKLFNNQINPLVLKKLKADPLFKKTRISSRKNILLYPCKFNPDQETKVINSLNQFSQHLKRNSVYNISTLGIAQIRALILKEVFNSFAIFLPIVALIVLLSLFLLFRQSSAITLMLTNLSISSITVGCLIYLYQGGFSPISSFSIIFVFIIATSDLIHILGQLKIGEINCENFNQAAKAVYRPCLLTSLTTALAMIGLCFSPIKTLHLFGLIAILGAIISFITTFYILPILLPILKLNWYIPKPNELFNKLLTKNYFKIARFITPLLLLTSVILIPALRDLNFSDDFQNKFVSTHPYTESLELARIEFNFSDTLGLLYDSRIVNEEKIELLSKHIERHPLINITQASYLLKDSLNYQLNNLELAKKLTNMAAISTELGIYSNANPLIRRVLLKLNYTTSAESDEIIAWINTCLANLNLTEQVQIKGFSVLRNQFFKSIQQSFYQSALIGIILLAFVFIILTRSIKKSIWAIVVNLLPLSIIISILNLLGVPFGLNIPIITAILFGIGVDDTIHYLYNLEESKHLTTTQTIKKVAWPITCTSILLSCGFLVFLYSDIKIFTEIASSCAAGLFIALIADLYILPYMLRKDEE